MSADWYYMKRRWIGGTKKIGPITDQELIERIDHGEIKPETLLISSKTRNRWVKMEEIASAVRHWHKTHPAAGSH